MPPDPDHATIIFSQDQRPPLESGDYTIKARQDLSGPVTAQFCAPDRVFHVKGVRFTLPPPTVSAMFPPANACGDFAHALPHVVLTEPTLPWQRDPDAQVGASLRGENASDPWLALILVHEGDVAPHPLDQAVPILNLTQRQLRHPAADTFFPNLDQEVTDDDDAICQAVDLEFALFNKVAPSREDLACLTHVRTVTGAAMARKARRDARPDRTRPDLVGQDGVENGCFAVVIGNRLPIEGVRSRVHLVSLEGYGPYLRSPKSVPFPVHTEKVRLTLLAEWTFMASAEDAGRFAALLEHVRLATPNTLQLPVPGPVSTRIKPILADGHVPLQHTLRTGDGTVSWYRGPLLPYRLEPDRILSPSTASTSDTLLHYDAETGLFDASYAAAWQLGRLLALQSRDFSTTVYAWREGELRKAVAASARMAHRAAFGTAHSGTAHCADDRPRNALRNVLSTTLRRALGFAPAAAGRSAPALPDPLPSAMTRWLGALATLKAVPFDYLVPDATMLPPESLRFFQLDANWIANLLDGALGIGRTSAARQRHDAAAMPSIRAAIAAARPGNPAAASVISGFLLRSTVVKGWPALEVRAFGKAGQGDALTVLRLDRLAPDLLFCLLEGDRVIAELELREPSEGMHFGVDLVGQQGEEKISKILRDPDTGLLTSKSVTASLPADGRIDIANLFGVIGNALEATPFTSAEFALQMTEGVAQVLFRSGPSAPGADA
ncbi:hypothetical protein [Sphingomonas sp. GB1N7]|uniref:hypothetical protein n=1 Tax=Parasphingomonas caseinilytica TaxID=3096158 RepID=UPI002FC6987F